MELQRDVGGDEPVRWPVLEMDGYRVEFKPRPDGPPHYEVPGPPTWVRMPGAVGKREVGYANASYAHCPPWLVDSGATFHAISREQALAEGADEFRKCKAIDIDTANGTTPSDEEVNIFVPQLRMWVWARVLDSTPKLLSLGLL